MRIINRQPLNVELLTLDDGTQKIAWDLKQIKSLLGISDFVSQDELTSLEPTTTGINFSGIPTIEIVIAVLDELGLKDLYQVRYLKQYATIIPKTESKRPKVAFYVVQQQSELALSIHDKIWTSYRAKFHLYDDNDHELDKQTSIQKDLYIPFPERSDFFGRFLERSERADINLSDFEDEVYYPPHLYRLPTSKFSPLILDMTEQNICYEITSDQRFPSTSRISLSQHSELKRLLLDLKENIEVFLLSNGEKPELLADYVEDF
ncbi:hypothetical protein H6F42_04475 [Pseudanabaena sp. FACHB-1998]|uniref:hypothetical protein n=1 Tax=Pseudanabaena sp. FACHB-1998 TaxID=2692858 RepID=UPI0016816786|nr:hypothetical protein [Pseudanabaena sp. FACHB-1998]MBD2176174.1 hypothetical protein [Pseudanabaena sp. FACHB-1998]